MSVLADQEEAEITRRSGNRLSGVRVTGEPFERELTAVETALETTLDEILAEDTHGVWHRFKAEVLDAGNNNSERAALAEAFAGQHPGWVELASCDNDSFMSSAVGLVRHGTGDNHMGTHLVYLPQGEAEPVELFLYPGHALSLLRALRAVEPTLRGVSLPADVPTSPEQFVQQAMQQFRRKPTSFDFFRNCWRDKPWYAEMGHTARLEAIAAGETP